MSFYSDTYKMISDLYNSGHYDEVIKKVDKLLELGVKNINYVRAFKYFKAKSLRFLDRFDESIEELKKLIIEEENSPFYNMELFFVYYYVEKYKEALNLLPKLYLMKDKDVSNHSLLIMELVIRKNLNSFCEYNEDTRSKYLKGQIVNYDEELTLQHIISHKYHEDSYNIHSIFKPEVNIKYLMDCVKENLKTNNKVNVKDVMEIHYFALPGIGYDDNNICNYLKVVVCPGTKNIITMYPFAYANTPNIPVLNCDMNKLYNRVEPNNSRIDKFNRRFNLK